jgi:hypothetical protein
VLYPVKLTFSPLRPFVLDAFYSIARTYGLKVSFAELPPGSRRSATGQVRPSFVSVLRLILVRVTRGRGPFREVR